MDSIPRMSRPRRRELIRLGRRSGDPATALRFLMIAKLGTGASRQRVAAELGTAASTVIRAAQRFVRDGTDGLYDRRAANGRSKIGAAYREQLLVLLYLRPLDCGWRRPTWTRELLAMEMERRGFPAVAACTMGRTLAAIGASLKSPRPVLVCPWGSRRRQRCIVGLRRLVEGATPDEPVLYGDEVDIHLNPRLGHDWMPRGHQRWIVTPGKNQKAYLAGAFEPATGDLHWVGADRKNSALFCKLLWRLAARYRHSERIHLIVDNFGIHDSRETRRCLESLAGRVVLHFLPPYSPEHNRIERVWQDLHANVTRNHRCGSMRELMVEVNDFLRGYRRWRARKGAARHALRRAA